MNKLIIAALILCGCTEENISSPVHSMHLPTHEPKEPSRIKSEYRKIQHSPYTETYAFVDPEGNEGIVAITGIRSQKPETKVIYFKDAKNE